MNSKTILIVDDTETNIDILIELLCDKYDLLVAVDAKNALKIVAEEKIDLILLDIMMPVTDGYEVCEILKADDDTKNSLDELLKEADLALYEAKDMGRNRVVFR